MRVLFAIGCNSYEHANQLNGAETDAQRIFESLMRPEIGDYDVERSCILHSPTLDEVRHALSSALFTTTKLDTFTFFFAGHGSVSAGSFYMLLKDSNPTRLSVSALSLTDIFRSINEAAPLQSNIVIDACESGGLIEDLGTLLKPSLLGNAETSGVTLCAMAAQNQTAGETADGGYGTVALLDCIEGRDFVQDHKVTLDLVEIGMKLSRRLQPMGQNPTVWGLNLYGSSGFCKNPYFASDPASPLRQALYSWPDNCDSVIKQNYKALWTAYSTIDGVWDVREFSTVVRTVLNSLAEQPDVLALFTDRLAVTFLQKALHARDPFRSLEVASTFAVALLPSVNAHAVADVAQRLIDHACNALIDAMATLVKDLDNDKYALLSDRAGPLSELHELPLRLTRIIGWSSSAIFLCRNDAQRAEAEAYFQQIVRFTLEYYCGSITSLNDAQAAGWCVALAACAKLGLREEGEQLIGLLFNSLVSCKGRLAIAHIPRKKALKYLISRSLNDYSDSLDLVARPIELLTVLLKATYFFKLESVFDEALWEIDGLVFSAYLPSDYSKYGLPVMEGGDNLVWTIGHDVFRTADFLSSWPAGKVSPSNQLVASLSITASLLYPDRQAWFLLDS